ncbi:hypothetical protein OG905_00470 [Streptomyces sp. NBC_00322]|uniref:hypothetical protein n=1 Tax=Streptomyces sp. NBC_00322 TaxID=2975712 RepID=UPI002E2CA1EB|nr:hypothetical protein [Streptomyces sp. NBC_00322]
MKTTPLHANPGRVLDALAAVSQDTGVPLSWDQGVLRVDGRPMHLPDRLVGEDSALFGIAGILPSVPRGDSRDRLLWRMLQETRPSGQQGPALDAELREKLPHLLPVSDPDGQEALAGALRERYYTRDKAPFLLPLQTDLPYGFSHTKTSIVGGIPTPKASTGYRMFAGDLLPFLCWKGNETDEALLQELLDKLNDDSQVTRLDSVLLQAARQLSGIQGQKALASVLVERNRERLQEDFAYGSFCQPQLDRFQTDLRTLLATKLPRPDFVRWVTVLISLHASLLMYRVAVVQSARLDRAVAAAHELPSPGATYKCEGLENCPLAGQLMFRTGTGGYRPVSRRDGCHTSWQRVDGKHLLSLPATLITANLAARVWESLGGPPAHRPDLEQLADSLAHDADLRRRFNAGAAAVTVLHHHAHWAQTTRRTKGMPPPSLDELLQAADVRGGRIGLLALREDVTRLRRSDLRKQSRDVVNQLMLHQVGGLLSRNGTSMTFYEVDEDLLTLLVRLICRDEPVAFELFLSGLAEYGLQPQDAPEQERLTQSLERLGLLIRYSDAGEATYVRYNR